MDKEANSSPSGFFRFMTAQSLQEGSLRILERFVDRHENCFHKYACLEVPTGAIRKVEPRKSNGRVWLQNGWREFTEFYNIKEDYFLVFKHETGSFIHAFIFSKSGLEIKYPAGSAFTTPKVTEMEAEDVTEMEDEDVTEMEDSADEDEDEDTDVSSDDYDNAWPRKSHKYRSTEPLVNRSGKRQVGESGIKKKVSLSASLKQKLNCTRFKRKVLEKAGIFKSEKPHFIIYMTPTYVAQNNVTRIPVGHFKGYLKKDYNRHGQDEMVLLGSKGRSWRMKFTVNDRNPNDAAFSYGWREFVEENEVEEGDVCMFEMMNAKVKEYKVTTYSLGDYP